VASRSSGTPARAALVITPRGPSRLCDDEPVSDPASPTGPPVGPSVPPAGWYPPPPPPPWGTWYWGDGTPIDPARLPPFEQSKKTTAGVLGILLGGLGIHKFVLGYTGAGVIQIVITLLTCGVGAVIGLIEGILYLTKSDAEFYWTYVVGRKEWF
jgi:TM2 domain-containing membrane protein YozV